MKESYYDRGKRKKKERHKRWHEQNRRLIVESGHEFIDKGETFLFRPVGRPIVDFYPSVGSWRYCYQMFYGGAEQFLIWYEGMLKGFGKVKDDA